MWGHLGEGGRRDPELGRELQHQPAGLVQGPPRALRGGISKSFFQ